MKAFSPQGTYLLEHRKYRIRQKHRNCKICTMHPESYKGQTCYFYKIPKAVDTLEDCEVIVYTAKPKQNGSFEMSVVSAAELRKLCKGMDRYVK